MIADFESVGEEWGPPIRGTGRHDRRLGRGKTCCEAGAPGGACSRLSRRARASKRRLVRSTPSTGILLVSMENGIEARAIPPIRAQSPVA